MSTSDKRPYTLYIPPALFRLTVWASRAQLVKAKNALSEALSHQGRKPFTKSMLRPSASSHFLIRKHKGEYSLVFVESLSNMMRPSGEKITAEDVKNLLEQFSACLKGKS